MIIGDIIIDKIVFIVESGLMFFKFNYVFCKVCLFVMFQKLKWFMMVVILVVKGYLCIVNYNVLFDCDI